MCLQGVEEGATLTEKVHIGAGTIVRNDVKIKGPTTIGENCVLENCVIGPYATIEGGCMIKNAEVNNSIILKNCTIDCPLKFTESIVGEKAEIVKKYREGKVKSSPRGQ